MLVDDEASILTSLKRELHDWATERSLEIVTAGYAKEGLNKLAEIGEDTVLIVSDLKMPEMNGSDFLMEAKRQFPDIIAVLLTGYAETQEVVKAVRAGVFSYLLKPWDSAFLINELTKAFNHAENRSRNKQYRKLMEEELKYAGELQRTVLRPNLPNSEGVEFKASYRPLPSLNIGGDYYDVIFLGPGRYLVLIGDVAGHGVRAAIITAILKTVIYPEYVVNTIGHSFSPSAFLGWLNDRMNLELRSASDLQITFFAGVIDVNTATLRYANAGQNHPFLVRMGKTTELPVSGSAIGFARSVHYAEQLLDLIPTDILVFYTDGLVTATGKDAAEDIKLGQVLGKLEYGTDYHRRIMESALSEMTRPDFSDDVTILTARIG